jgi:hypothetical protein
MRYFPLGEFPISFSLFDRLTYGTFRSEVLRDSVGHV